MPPLSEPMLVRLDMVKIARKKKLWVVVWGFYTRINAMVDALGNPLKFILSPGQEHDIKAALHLIEGIIEAYVLADKGYDDDNLIKTIKAQRCKAVIPP